MKTIAFEANGYSFEADINEDSYLGQSAMQHPLDRVIGAFVASAEALSITPDNIDEMNKGGTQIIYRIVS